MRSLFSVLAVLGAIPAFAGEAPLATGDPAQAQSIVTQVCAACHGADGNSPVAANPSLAGQHAAYLVKQLQDFKSGARKSAVMGGMVANLSPEDMKNLGAFFAEKSPKVGVATNKQLVVFGEKVYRGGDQVSGVPACAGCHGPNGAGIPVQFPRLASQHGDYVLAQLNLFRTGERGNDPAKMMRLVAQKMTDQEIRSVSEYISGLH